MESLAVSYTWLAVAFLVVAFCYSSVGLGGGSSYTALMTVTGLSFVVIPTISLILNTAVTSVGSYHFIRRGHARVRLIVPFLISSIPMAYLGGQLELPRQAFCWILLGTLVCVALRIYVWRTRRVHIRVGEAGRLCLAFGVGGLLGFVAGTVGIGGGIYLVPLIIVLGLGTPKEAAAAGAIFIWVNSAAGLIARLPGHSYEVVDYVPLILAALVGGVLGSRLGAGRLSQAAVQRVLGVIVLAAIGFLGKQLLIG